MSMENKIAFCRGYIETKKKVKKIEVGHISLSRTLKPIIPEF